MQHIFRVTVSILSVVLLCLGVLLLDEWLALDGGGAKLFANFLPVLLLYGALLALTRRPLLAFMVSISVILSIFSVNAAKIHHLGEPVTFPDVFLVEQAISGWHLMSKYVSGWAYFALFVLTGALYLGWRYERPLRYYVTLPLLLCSIGGFSYIALADRGMENLYSTSAHGAKQWMISEVAYNQGLLASLVTSARVAKLDLPEYDEHRLNSFVKNYNLRTLAPEPDVKPDIVIWLAESFFDPGIISGVDTCKLIPEYCELSNQSLVSALDVPTFGGNTTRTEFEVLTGIPFFSLGTQSFPYAVVVHEEFNSIAWTLARNGYSRTAIHPHKASFWQRNRALPLLGFDEFLTRSNMGGVVNDGVWASDDSLADLVVDALSQAKEPKFVFAISMEGHGPYDKRDVLDNLERDNITTLPGLTGKLADNWRQYIYHARRAARAMQKLKSFVDNRERPTLVVYFGDHLPGLRPLFAQVDFKDGRTAVEQKTPALAFSNFQMGVDWLPEASHELGLWALVLSGQVSGDSYSQLARATGIAKQAGHDELSEAVEQFQVRQLYR